MVAAMGVGIGEGRNLAGKRAVLEETIKSRIRSIPDYPKRGVVFRDLTPLFRNYAAFDACIDALAKKIDGSADLIAGIEARGFIIGAALAGKMGLGFIPIRKENKLPWDKIKAEYVLEYGSGKLEVHKDAVEKGEKVAIVDDLLATGGSSLAAAELIEELGGKVAVLAFVVELSSLGGREKLKGKGYRVFSLAKY